MTVYVDCYYDNPVMTSLLLLFLLSSLSITNAQHTLIEDHSYGDRAKDALFGFLVGLFLVIFSIPTLWFVEQIAVEDYLVLNRCRKACKRIEDCSEKVNTKYEERPVHITGKTKVINNDITTTSNRGKEEEEEEEEELNINHDKETGFIMKSSKKAVRLKRVVEMYQWVEKSKKEEKRTVYTYDLQWCEHDSNSSQFHMSIGHHNPIRNPSLYSTIKNAFNSTYVGSYQLIEEQIQKLHHFQLCPIEKMSTDLELSLYKMHGTVERGPKHHQCTRNSADDYTSLMQKSCTEDSDYLVYNGSILHPTPGTIRISYEAVHEEEDISLVGVQVSNSFRPFTKIDAHKNITLPSIWSILGFNGNSNTGKNEDDLEYERLQQQQQSSIICCAIMDSIRNVLGTIIGGSGVLLVEERITTPAVMFHDETVKMFKKINLLRLLGCFLLSLGLYLLVNPVAVMLSFIPYLSGILSNAFWIAALLLGFTIGALVISIAWVVYHPEVLAGLMFAIGVPVWIAGSTFVGEVLCILALFPSSLYVLHRMEEKRYLERLQQLDEMESEDEPLLAAKLV